MLGFGLSIEPQLWTLLFVMVRVSATFIAAPVFGAISVPLQVRIALSGAIGFLVLAANPVTPPAQIFAITTFLAVAAEALVGLAIGFVLQIAFAAPLVAGELIGNSMGIGFASAMNGHLMLVELVVRSYAVLPPGSAWIAVERLRDIAVFGGYAFSAGFLLALPVGFLLLCLNLVVGMLSRSAPALNLFAVGLPMSLAVGVIALAIAFPAMGDYMIVIIQEGLAAAEHLVIG
ncbi:MAG: flagellar biosynthetic protein FliR [Sphingomonas sp. 12-62-6]|nr:MAG: flagellar biosynthetic protein FliR [Sphingomonas sp. 12-62-6]